MDEPELLTTIEVAAWLRVPVQTLYAWRSQGLGPRGLKVGRHLRWRREDVERWLADRGCAEPAGAAR